ncbi:MAG TPA: DUF4184 family protein, partial [archaeon]|nr:DUF4184 family protein [archaeon]
WDSFETHFYSHSIIGVIAVGVAAALALKALKTSSLEFNSLALSGVFGAATHVFVDLFTHTTPDELKLLLPLPWKFGQLYHAAAYDALTFLSVAVAVWMLALWRKGVFTRRRFIEKQYP